MIKQNKAPRVNSILFGFCCIAEGLVRVFSLGFLHGTFTLDFARKTAQARLKKKLAAYKDEQHV